MKRSVFFGIPGTVFFLFTALLLVASCGGDGEESGKREIGLPDDEGGVGSLSDHSGNDDSDDDTDDDDTDDDTHDDDTDDDTHPDDDDDDDASFPDLFKSKGDLYEVRRSALVSAGRYGYVKSYCADANDILILCGADTSEEEFTSTSQLFPVYATSLSHTAYCQHGAVNTDTTSHNIYAIAVCVSVPEDPPEQRGVWWVDPDWSWMQEERMEGGRSAERRFLSLLQQTPREELERFIDILDVFVEGR